MVAIGIITVMTPLTVTLYSFSTISGSCCAGIVHQEAGIASSILQRRKLRLREGNFLFKLQ